MKADLVEHPRQDPCLLGVVSGTGVGDDESERGLVVLGQEAKAQAVRVPEQLGDLTVGKHHQLAFLKRHLLG